MGLYEIAGGVIVNVNEQLIVKKPLTGADRQGAEGFGGCIQRASQR